ncbi:MAG TPA: hypothetical protein VGC20_04635 [bacterium]
MSSRRRRTAGWMAGPFCALALAVLCGAPPVPWLAPAALAIERSAPPERDPLRSAQGDPFRLSPGQPFRSPAIEPFHVAIPGGIGHQPCIRCHFEGMGTISPQEDLPRKYSIQSAFRTYWSSPHGRLRALGEHNAPRCVDCHLTQEWREILPQEHPDSPINPKNLARICAKCHGAAMLQARVMDGSMHLELQRRSLKPGTPPEVRYGFLPGLTKLEKSYYIGKIDVMAWVNFAFLVLTVGTLCFLALFMLLDLYRKLMERRAKRSVGGHETA